MSPSLPAVKDSATLVAIVELKWLLTGYGVTVHVEQLQTDPQYALGLLDRAATIPNRALQAAADQVRDCLGLIEGSPGLAQRTRGAATA